MNERPLVWWSASALAAMALAVDATWRRWRADWGVAPTAADAPSAANAAQADAACRALDWRSCQGGRGAWLGLAGGAAERGVEALLFGATAPRATGAAPSTLAGEVAAAGWRDLQGALAATLERPGASDVDRAAEVDREWIESPAAEPPPAAEWRPWSGAFCVRWPGAVDAPPAMSLLVSGPLAGARFAFLRPDAATLPRAGGLAPIGEAIAAQRVRLRVELDAISLDLGTLQSLRPGDVLSLGHRLDEPLCLRTPDAPAARAVALALLGQRDGRRAVELVADPHA